jgi:hypothetical protein
MSKTLGEMEDAMAVFRELRPPARELPGLQSLALDRPMRNYEAHEDIVRSATGDLAVIDASGAMVPINLEELDEHLITLRSFLDGVDAAIGVAFMALSLDQPFPAEILRTEAFVRELGGLAIAELTDAVLVDCTIRDGTITLQIDGSASEGDLGLVAHSLRRLLDPAVTAIRIERPSGTLLYDKRLADSATPKPPPNDHPEPS